MSHIVSGHVGRMIRGAGCRAFGDIVDGSMELCRGALCAGYTTQHCMSTVYKCMQRLMAEAWRELR